MGMKLPLKLQKQVEATYHYYGDKYVKRPKYSNRSCTCWARHNHQSILEADYCNELNVLKKGGEIKAFQIQFKIDLRVNGIHISNYFADFLVTKNDGSLEVHETKGAWTETAKIKWALSQALYPEMKHIAKYEKPNSFFRSRR